jgi:DNA-binding SARP family transcriptional activator/tetratricopeptide (TPR) repeat protein
MLRLFGPTRVSGIAEPRLPRSAFVAVALLDLTASRHMTREELAARLWEGAAAARASNNFRQLLARIRAWEQATGQVVVRTEGRVVSRDATALPSDLSLFLAIDDAGTPAGLRWLAELYGGDLLADVEPEAEFTAQWVAEQRSWLRDRFIRLAVAGVRVAGGPVAEDVLRRLTDEAPYDDVVIRAAMVAARHDPAAVRAIYQRFARRLELDLGSTPEARTTALLGELARGALPAAAPPSDLERPAVSAALDSVPRVLILPPGASDLAGPERHLGDALVDEVTHTLSRLRTFAVFAPHTARQLARGPFPGGNPYGADYLVATRLAPGPAGARLTVALTRLATQELLLSEELPFVRGDLNAHHVHLAAALGARLAQGIERAEQRLYRTTGSASAYVHYLIGCENLRTIDLRALRRAKGHFRQAIRLSRDFVPARAMLARTLCLEWILLDRNEREPIEAAVALAREAAGIDPLDPLAHREVGHALLYLDAIDEGVEALRAATQLGPHHADVLFHYADGLIHLGAMPEARRVMDRALALNPLAPDLYHWVSATADYFLGHYAAASVALKRMRQPESAARVIAAVEAMNGNLDEARRQRDIYLAAHPDFRLADYMFPQRRPEDRAHYLEGLRRAGFA